MPKLRLYDLFDGADYVGAFTSKEITTRLGISMNAFYNCSKLRNLNSRKVRNNGYREWRNSTRPIIYRMG